MDRSLAFTCLLEWPEFRVLEVSVGERVTTELVALYRSDPTTVSMWDAYLAYRRKHEGRLAEHARTLTPAP